MERSNEWFKRIIVPVQGAAQTGCSSMNTSMLLRETIAWNRERDSTVYVTLLDAQKAFDTVWIDGLFHKLFEHGMDRKMWRILRQSYNDFQCCVRINNVITDLFYIRKGVHQGDVMSMQLYQIYNNDLLKQLMNSGYGATIKGINVTCPAFADDISLVSLFKRGMQVMLNIAYEYSVKWRFNFNHTKTVMILLVTRQ